MFNNIYHCFCAKTLQFYFIIKQSFNLIVLRACSLPSIEIVYTQRVYRFSIIILLFCFFSFFPEFLNYYAI